MFSLSKQQNAINNRQKQRFEQCKRLRKHLDQQDEAEKAKWSEIIGQSWIELKDNLQNGIFSPVEVLHAFQDSALKAHSKTNCITEFLKEAEDEAIELDKQYRSSKSRPALFGLPFSLKESIELKNHDMTFGLSKRIGDPICEDDATVIKVYRQLGAIPFVRTNTPQMLVSFNCSNPIYGVTSNPFNQQLTSGGSSGGEGALVSMRGSAFGMGTDGGGSIRIPASFCGAVGLKPTSTRWANKGMGQNLPGVAVLGFTIGPITTSVDACTDVFRALVNSELASEDDVYYNRVPFNDHIYNTNEPMRIGWYTYDGYTEVTPAISRAVNDVKEKLIADGHELVPWMPPTVKLAIFLFMRTFLPDYNGTLKEALNSEVIDTNNRQFFTTIYVPVTVLRIAAYLVNLFFPRLANAMRAFVKTPHELTSAYHNIREYRKDVVNQLRNLKIDALIAPPFAHTACTHKFPDECSAGSGTTALYNLLDFPAGVVPVTYVTAEDEKECENKYQPIDSWAKMIKQNFSNNTVGCPVGVQCVALPNQEEKCLRLMKIVERLVQKN